MWREQLAGGAGKMAGEGTELGLDNAEFCSKYKGSSKCTGGF